MHRRIRCRVLRRSRGRLSHNREVRTITTMQRFRIAERTGSFRSDDGAVVNAPLRPSTRERSHVDVVLAQDACTYAIGRTDTACPRISEWFRLAMTVWSRPSVDRKWVDRKRTGSEDGDAKDLVD